MNPVEHLEQFFKSDHLPEHLAKVSRKFENLKDDLLKDVNEINPEITAGLRKLLDAKDCFVRAAVIAKKDVPELVKDVTE